MYQKPTAVSGIIVADEPESVVRGEKAVRIKHLRWRIGGEDAECLVRRYAEGAILIAAIPTIEAFRRRVVAQ